MKASGEQSRNILRQRHSVRLVARHEEGTAAEHLPAGMYGFTGAPALAAPLFAERRYRNFEVHRLADGIVLVGFVTPAEKAQLAAAHQPVEVKVYPDVDGEATEIIAIPHSRIAHHREYLVRNSAGITLQLLPGEETALV